MVEDLDIESFIRAIELPHELFSLCSNIAKGQAGPRLFQPKDKNYYIYVFCFPKDFSATISIRKPGSFGSTISEENISLHSDGHCEYSVAHYYTSLVAESTTYLVNRDKYIEDPPFRDWIKQILDGAYNALKNSIRINPYTGEELPYFEDTSHDKYLREVIGELNKKYNKTID